MKMKIPTTYIFFFLISTPATFLEASNNGDGGFIFEENEETRIKRSDFPSGFLFGTGTSAFQVEGAYLEDSKSLSNWDVFCHSGGCGENGDNGDIADDHYHLFLRDIEQMYSLGIQAYKFSVSWCRILPRGRLGEVNPAGIMFYNKIIDNLILRGIVPFVTIYHEEFPQELEDRYGSWLNPEMQEEFLYLAEVCFKSFGDRVKYWITINEAKLIVEYAYLWGTTPPSRCSEPFGKCFDGNSDVEPIIAMHNMLLAHGRAAKLYHEYFQPKQGGSIGLTVYADMYEPLTDRELDHEAAKRAFAFHCGWTFDPSIFGDYPDELKECLGNALPSFSRDEKNFMKNSLDFIGINHYSTIYAKDCTNSSCSATENRAIQGFVETVGERDDVLIGEQDDDVQPRMVLRPCDGPGRAKPNSTPSGLMTLLLLQKQTGIEGSYVVPRGMEEIVNLIKIRYNNMPMFITENGYSSPDVHEQRVNELTNDVKRIEYHTKHLASLAKSIRGGADVRGYFVWSLMDNLEWLSGYNVRFGLYYVDRKTQVRIPKLSAKWYKNFLINNTDLADKETSRFDTSS